MDIPMPDSHVTWHVPGCSWAAAISPAHSWLPRIYRWVIPWWFLIQLAVIYLPQISQCLLNPGTVPYPVCFLPPPSLEPKTILIWFFSIDKNWRQQNLMGSGPCWPCFFRSPKKYVYTSLSHVMPAQKKRQWRRKDHMHFLARQKSWAPTEMTFIVLKKIPAQTPGPALASS